MTDELSTKKWLSLYRLHRPSFLLLLLPYIAFSWKEFLHSPFFSIGAVLSIVIVILAMDTLVKLLILPGTWLSKTCINLLVGTTIVFLYGYYFLADLQQLTLKFGRIPVRMRTIFILVFLLVTALQFAFFRKKWFYTGINSYLLIFSVLVIVFPGHKRQSSSRDIRFLPMHPLALATNIDTIKPVVLIIADEYQSPEEMASFFKDPSLLHFSDSLASKCWRLKNNFPSIETSTIYSISSLMNFNLSEKTDYYKQNSINIGIHKLSSPALQDSLQKKNVHFINYGIFDLGRTPALSAIYFYPTNFLEHFLIYTSYFVIKYNTGGFEMNGFQEKYSPFEAHNRQVLETLADTLSHSGSRTFVYAHLLMPHKPFQYSPGFPMRTSNKLEDYKDYWNFTNSKLAELLVKLSAENKYRIILTGDHGIRKGDSLKSTNTFGAFYQFDSTSINQIRSVQDLGSLINQSFN